ncbi:MAG: ATP-binding protein [Candidatus Omnitrophota bacterium]
MIKINFKERKLFFAFAVLIFLTFLIGLVGMSQIQGLYRRVADLGSHNLRLESAVLEMRMSNTVYAMGIRNYVFWRASRYLGAAPMAVDRKSIVQSGDNFKKQLELYRETAYLPQQQEWADHISASFEELLLLGSKIIESADKQESGKINEAANNLLMGFENLVYRIDGFLDSSMGKDNLKEIERQMDMAEADKDKAIFFLQVSLIGALVFGTLFAFSVYRRRIEERAYRQQLFNHMINVEELERKKLSTAVHDEMGQDLSALKIYLGLISQAQEGFGEDAKNKIQECRKITSGLIDKSHNIAFLLRPPDLDEVGLLESLESLLLESKHLTGVNYVFQKPDEKFELLPEYSLMIYRISQELLTNMAKHSQAKNVNLRLEKENNFIRLSYRDDGRGFDPEQNKNKFTRRHEDKFRFGLLGLKERVEVLDGEMFINSSLGKGAEISVTFPV